MEVSKGQWQGHPRRVERPLPLSFFLETDFICFLNLNPGRFFTLLADRVYVMTLGVFFGFWRPILYGNVRLGLICITYCDVMLGGDLPLAVSQ
jgi:hypothetical protein